MTPRERVLAAMRRQTPDRPPLEFNFTPSLMETLKEKTGKDNVQEAFDLDVVNAGLAPAPTQKDYSHWHEGRSFRPGTTINGWGVAQEPGSLYHFTHRVSPLAGKPAAALADYELPDRDHPACFEGLAEKVAAVHARGYAASGMVGHTYETAWQVRGLDEFLTDMVLDPDPLEAFVERIAEQNREIARQYAKAGVDVVRFGDDVANQRAMMFSPDLWRRFFKERLRSQIAAARAEKPDVLTWYHSDGNVEAILPELIEVGVDILNPVQPECMDLPSLKERYGDAVSFWGCIGTQTTMPWGTPDEVRRTVAQTVETMGPGLLVAPTHVLEPEVPWENILALTDAVKSYRY